MPHFRSTEPPASFYQAHVGIRLSLSAGVRPLWSLLLVHPYMPARLRAVASSTSSFAGVAWPSGSSSISTALAKEWRLDQQR